MRPTDYASELLQMVNDLRVSELLSVLNTILDSNGNQSISDDLKHKFSDLIFSARDGFRKIELDERKRLFLNDYGLSAIFSPRNTTEMLNIFNMQPDYNHFRTTPLAYNIFRNLQLRLSNLLVLSKTVSTYLVDARIPLAAKTSEFLRIVVFDADNSGIDPIRLSQIVKVLGDLACTVAEAINEKNQKLKIALIESGSDTEIWLYGALVVTLRELLKKSFDFLINRENVQFERDLESLASALKVVERIEDRKRLKEISESDALQFKKTIFERVKALFRLGACPRESADVSLETIDRRKILIEHNQKLLETKNENQQSLQEIDKPKDDESK